MKKHLCILSLCFVLLLSAGCGNKSSSENESPSQIPEIQNPDPSEQDLMDEDNTIVIGDQEEVYQLTESATYYNGYFNLKYTIPAGWWVVDLSDVNLDTIPDGASDPGSFKLYKVDDNYYSVDIMEISNYETRIEDDFLTYRAYADKIEDGLSLEQFIPILRENIFVNDTITPISEEEVVYNGQNYYKIHFRSENSGNPSQYQLYLQEVNDYIMINMFFYWERHPNPDEAIEDFIEQNLGSI